MGIQGSPSLQQLTLLSHAAVANWSAQELLEHYVLEATQATGATRGFVALAEAEVGGLVLLATAGDGWTDEARQNRLSERDRTNTITSLVARTGAPVRVANAPVDVPGYAPFFPGICSVLAVPLALERDERVRGVLNLESDRLDAFTGEHEAFAQTVADLAALRLSMDDLRERETALVQIGKELSGSPDLDAMLDRVVEITSQVLRAEECSLYFLDQASQQLTLAATRGKGVRPARKAYVRGEGQTGTVATTGAVVRDLDDMRAFLGAPIPSVAGVVGVLRVIRKESSSPWFPNDFTDAEEEALLTIAAQVGAAMDNARLFARLMQSERMATWGEMSAMSSHMIGNRVFAIKGELNELEYVLRTGGEVRPLVEGMKRGIFRLEELLAEFRDFVRAGNLAPTPGDLNELTQAALGETFPKRSTVVLEASYTAKTLPVVADGAKLKRAFSELIENAVTFMEAMGGGTLKVTTRIVSRREPLPTRLSLPRSDYALLSFEDTGPGIPESEKERIFRPFVTSRARGMGLGLAIVKGIIEAHHGGIVETGAEGEGARFEIALPLKKGGK
ncbi:GAF domain-containing protein [Armatimonas sp.]|uniref:GAF domain-containing protein n=1 Tax=Armatimonas sp. TaxID=1872638 RepID=UPI00375037E8